MVFVMEESIQSGRVTTNSNTPLIFVRKPHGEVSRRGRNGYNLKEEVGLDDAAYQKVQVRSCLN